MISNNKERFERELWTDNEQGNDVVLITARNPNSESEFVTRELNFLVKKGISPEEIAVMYRVNAQSRSMEDRLEELKIPYRLIGALGFRERRVVKDLLEYLTLLINPYYENSLARIINTPRRGISDATYDLIRRGFLDQTEYESVVEYIRSKPWKSDILLNKRAVTSLEKFLDLLEGLQAKAKVLSPENLISEVIKSSEYDKYLEDDPDYENRVRNVEELKIKARETSLDITDPFFRTVDFVQKFALVTKIDDPTIVGVQEDENAEKITLITLHQAKGLEYSVVFIIGFEQGMLPHSRSLDSFDEMEEERRLCYVGMTRAKERLYLTNCLQRVSWNDMGKTMFSQAQMPSQFLNEIPENLLKTADYTSAGSITYTNRKFKASDYEKPSSIRKTFSPHFSPSDVVRHKIFGRGIVVSVNKEHEEEEILVKFDELDETKLILPAFGSIHKEQSQSDEDPSQDFDFLRDWDGASRKKLPQNDDDFSDYFED